MGFAEDLVKFANKQEKSMEDAVTNTLFKLNDLVITRTPVDTGQARLGWIASLGSPSSGQVGGDVSGANSVARKAFGNVYWLTNNVKHIRPLEYGHSQKHAPKGMVRVSIREIQHEITKQVRALNLG